MHILIDKNQSGIPTVKPLTSIALFDVLYNYKLHILQYSNAYFIMLCRCYMYLKLHKTSVNKLTGPAIFGLIIRGILCNDLMKCPERNWAYYAVGLIIRGRVLINRCLLYFSLK